MTIRYCTNEWLEESARLYNESDHFQNVLQKVTTKIFFRIIADPTWGIEKDILFGAEVEEGKLLEMGFYNETEAQQKAMFILGAAPQVWKGLLRKEKKFITEFMTGKIQLETGSRVELLKVTPYANHFLDALTQFEIQFPDEMSSEELEAYRADLSEFRENVGV